MQTLSTLELLLAEINKCRKDNGLCFLVIDAITEQAIEKIQSISNPESQELKQIKNFTVSQLSTIPSMIEEYKKSFDKNSRKGDPRIHKKYVSTAENALSFFLEHYLILSKN